MTIKDVHLNNGKVLIGSAYYLNPLKPKYVEEDTDMLLIQSSLIYDPAIIRRQYLLKVAYGIFVSFLLFYLIVIS